MSPAAPLNPAPVSALASALLALSMVASWASVVTGVRVLTPSTGGPAVAAVLGALAAALTNPTGAAVRALAAALEAWAVDVVDARDRFVDVDHDALVTAARDVRAVLLDVAEELEAAAEGDDPDSVADDV